MKLTGLKVIDLSLFLPGPHLTMMMADHGADVIKVEPPGGEPVRDLGLAVDNHSVWFRNTHRGKRCISLNLKSDAGKEVFFALVKSADVIVESFRPGVVKRLGIDYDSVKAANPKIVYCSLSAFGQDGCDAMKPAHDLSIQAASGTLSINLGQDGKPAMPAMPAADMAGSLMAFSGILMALLRREHSGEGDYLDIALQDSLVAWLPNVMGPVFAEDRAPIVTHERSWGGNAFYQIYQTADNQYLTLGGSEIKFAKNLLTALERPELVDLCARGPGSHQAEVRAFLAETFAKEPMVYWEDYLTQIDVCWAPVKDLHSAIHSQHLKQRHMLVEDERGNKHLGIPIKYRAEPGRINPHLDEFGESTQAVLKEIGLTDRDIERLCLSDAFA